MIQEQLARTGQPRAARRAAENRLTLASMRTILRVAVSCEGSLRNHASTTQFVAFGIGPSSSSQARLLGRPRLGVSAPGASAIAPTEVYVLKCRVQLQCSR